MWIADYPCVFLSARVPRDGHGSRAGAGQVDDNREETKADRNAVQDLQEDIVYPGRDATDQ